MPRRSSGRTIGPDVVDHVAEAALHVAERHDAARFQARLELLPDRAVQHAVRLLLRGEEEGHVVELEGGLDLGDHRVGDDAHVHRAQAHAVQHRPLVAEGAVGEELHVHPLPHPLRQRCLEGARADRVGVLRAVAARPADPQHGTALGAGNARRQEHCGRAEGSGAETAAGWLDHGASSNGSGPGRRSGGMIGRKGDRTIRAVSFGPAGGRSPGRARARRGRAVRARRAPGYW